MKKSTTPKVLVTALVLLFTSFTTTVTAQNSVFTNNYVGPIVGIPKGVLVAADGTEYVLTSSLKVGRKSSASNFDTSWVVLTGSGTFVQDGLIGTDGNLYILRSNNTAGGSIDKITPAGVITSNWAALGGSQSFTKLIQAPNGNFYAASYGPNVAKITSNGTITLNWGRTPVRYNILNITADANSNIYVCKLADPTITKISSAGVTDSAWASPQNASGGIGTIIHNNGYIYASISGNVLVRISTAGVINNNWASVGGSSGVGSIAADNNGNLYVSLAPTFPPPSTTQIYKVTPTGVVSTFYTFPGPGDFPSRIINIVGTKFFVSRHKEGFFGSVDSAKVSLIDNVAFAINFNKTDATCPNSTDGAARAIPSGTCGTGYNYLWTPGNMTTDTVSNLAPGTYSVRVVCGTDTVNKSVVISSPTIAAPTTSNQSLCSSATVADLVATGTGIKWYAAATGGTELPSITPLINNTAYYASQTIAGCESGTRAANTVAINGKVGPIADTTFCNEGINGSSYTINFNGSSGTTYNWTSTSASIIAASGTTGSVSFQANNPGTSVIQDTVMVSGNYSSPFRYTISNGTYAFKDTVGSTYVTSQMTSGTGISSAIPIGFTFNYYGGNFTQAYITKFGNLAFANTTIGNGNIILGQSREWVYGTGSKASYKVSGTAPNRQFVVTFTSLEAPASITTTTTGPPPAYPQTQNTPITSSGTGTFQIILNETSNLIETAIKSAPTATYSYSPSFGVPVTSFSLRGNYHGVEDSLKTNNFYIRNNTDWVSITNESKIFTPVPGTSCPASSDTFVVTVLPTAIVDSIADQTFCSSSTTSAINFTTPITGTTVGYKWVNSKPSIGLAASGTGNVPSFTASSSNDTATISVTPFILKGTDTCFGTVRTFKIFVGIPPTPATSNQTLCSGATVADLLPTGSGVFWYAAPTGGSALASTTSLIDGTKYYAEATGAGCVSAARGVDSVTILSPVKPDMNDTTLCLGNGSTQIISFRPSNQEYSYVSTQHNTGITASGSLGLIPFIPTNTTNTVLKDTVIVTPILKGNPYSFRSITYNRIDTTGFTKLSFSSNDAPQSVNLGFTFKVGDSSFTSVKVYDDGYLSAVSDKAFIYGDASYYDPAKIGATYKYKTIGSAPNRRFVLSCDSLKLEDSYAAANGTNGSTFQIVLNETTNKVEVHSAVVRYADLKGIDYDYGAFFSAYSKDGVYSVSANEAVEFLPGSPITCTGTKDTMVVSILPNAKVDSVANFVVCNNNIKSAINFTTPTTGGTVTYAWTNDKTSIGLAASGTGNIAAFTATNISVAPITATITVTPTITSGGTSCTGTARTFTITVNPTAQINSLSSQVVCNGASTTAANFSTTRTGGTTTYAWTNNTTSIGLAANGTGNIAAFTATNNTTTPVTATIRVTPTFTNGGVSCAGADSTFTITVNPKGNVVANADKVLCNGATQAAINFSTNNTGGTTTYAWTNDNTAIGLAASGTGNINSFTVSNTTNDPDTAVIIVTPTFANGGTSCSGIKDTFYIVVNPVAKVDSISNKVVCNGSTVAVQTLTSSATGGIVTYSWTNNNTAIGLVASGTGNVPSFNATNTGTSAITATVTVTPTFTFSGVSCTGTARSYTITVNPPPIFNATNDKFVCNGSTTSAVVFSTTLTGGTAVYNWTNDNTAIGLAASGTGNVPSFTATNTTTAPIYGSIVVTMNYTNAGLTCISLKDTFDYVINPTATVNAINNQVVCNNGNTSAVSFGTTATGGTVTYAWTNNTTSIGLAANGIGNIAAFTATNNGTTPVTATITVTPTFTNGGVSCTGTARTFTITVNPTAQVNNISNQVVCNNANTTAVNFSTTHTGGTTTYAWTNNTTSIGLAASGTGNIAAFIATNTGTAPVTATITVTPTFTNGGVSCSGPSKIFTITVNPTATVNAIANQVVCNNSATTAVIFGTTATGGTVTYAWTNNAPSIGLAASGTGDIASFTGTNATAAPVTAIVTVTPTFTNGGVSCTGTARTFTITVNPTATVTAIPNRVECNGSLVAAIIPTSPNTGGVVTYSWVNNTPAIGLAASGTGTIPSFTAANTTNAPIVATVTITPTFTNGAVSCVGTPFSYTITINPPPIFNATANQAACNGATVPAIALTTPLTGGAAVFTWTNSNTAIGLAAGGTGNIPSFTATNTTNAPISGAISVMMTYTNAGLTCTSLPQAFTYTVNPTATINAVNNQTLCNRASTTAVNFSSPTTGGNLVYNWVNNNPAIGLAANGTGNIAVFTATNNTALPITATITVTPEFTNAGITCTGTVRTFTITVNPTPVTNFTINNAAQCLKNNQFVFTNTSTVANAYLWSLGDGSTATTTDINKVYATDGSYSIKLLSNNSFGCKDSITKSIIVYPQPATPIAVPVVNNGLHSNVTANSYAWYLNNTALSGATAQQYLPQTAGYYQVQVSTIQGCSQKSDSVYYIPERASSVRNGIEGQPMFVYPIPATGGNINIYFNVPLQHKVLCRMYTGIGQLLQTVEIPAGAKQYQLKVGSYPSANYVLRFDDYYKVTKGLVVQVIN